jgi:prepilin-type N-terminal cleavage/methylation domain-containing protein
VSRLRSQAGFTVVEMLVATMVLGIVAMAAMTMMDVVLRQGRGVLERTDSAQRGRLALDTITRQVRSQVCLNETTAGMIGATPTTLTFYADLSGGGARPTRRMLEYRPGTRTIRESVWVARVDGSYPAAATRTSELLDNVVPAVNGSGQPLPMFGYYAYPDPLPAAPRPDVALVGTPAGAPLTAAQLRRIAMVRINFAVRPASARDDTIVTPLRDDIQLRNADPNATTPDPTCR